MNLGDIRADKLIDTLQLGVVVHSHDTSIIYANPKALELLRITSDQALGRTAFDPKWCFLDKNGNRMPVDDYPVKKVVTSKSSLKDFQAGICDSSDGVTWLNCNAYPELRPDGEIDRITVIFIDISQNMEFKKNNDQKNQILGIAAHDLRNPLDALTNAFDLVSEFVNENDSELFSIIDLSINNMSAIIKDLVENQALNTAELAISKETHLLDELIHEVSNLNLQSAGKKGITIRTEMPDSITASFDYCKLQRALDNLLSNAIKFSPSPSEVTIGCELIDKGKIRIFVHDRGPGLTNQDKEKVFRPFQRLSAQPTAGEHSTGLGLSIVKKIAKLHGGDAGVISEYLKGAKFYLDLPR